MEDTITLELIVNNEANSLYRDAYQSYKEIYNSIMVKGKGNLEPKFIGGNPIQMEPNNIQSIFTSTLELNDYYISTKANGLRFMLMIGNKDLDGSRRIYLIDSKMNFWRVRQHSSNEGQASGDKGYIPPIPAELNIDKCLIDGELLFFGSIETKSNKGEIKEYIITKNGKHKPLIAFLAFDILYGPINPDYELPKGTQEAHVLGNEKDAALEYNYKLGNSGSMVGPKALGRWPTTRRRHVLEQLFHNPDSPLWKYIHSQEIYTLNRTKKITQDIERVLDSFSFTLFISPFIELKQTNFNNSKDLYEYMIQVFNDSIRKQYFKANFKDESIYEYKTLPPSPKSSKPGIGNGLMSDGIIFTPVYHSYLIGPWTFCNNKQYKWKPAHELTIDFQVGKLIKQERGIYYYQACVKKGKIIPFTYMSDEKQNDVLLAHNQPLTEKSIIECIWNNHIKDNAFLFEFVQKRYDKVSPNSYLTATSVMNAMNVRKELNFLPNKLPNVLDLVYYIYNKELTSDNAINLLLTMDKNKLMKCCLKKNPLLLFDNQEQILELISKKQSNPNYELELQINFKNNQRNYTECLIGTFIDKEYTPVPIVKTYDKSSTLRSVYVLMSDDSEFVIHENTINKKRINEINAVESFYNYEYAIVLSDESISDKQIKLNSGHVEYQVRYTIANISVFWRLDIIEYGNASNLASAKSAWEKSPKTRIELEYAPAYILEDLLHWENDDIFHDLFNQMGIKYINKDIIMQKFNEYKTKLNNTDPKIILADLGSSLIKLFDALDIDIGNYHNESTVKKKEHIIEKSNKREISDFYQMRKLHNKIKYDLLGQVVKELRKKNKKRSIKLLDISVGKGGDINKWDSHDIQTVYAIDPNIESINEAKRRYSQMIKNGSIKKTRDYKFDPILYSDSNIKEEYDIVSCHFTLHYLYKSGSYLASNILKIIKNLVPGGYFIGTTLIGDRVKKLVNKFPDKIKIDILNNHTYTMKYLDNAEGIYNSNDHEYFVDFNAVKIICEEYGLKLISKTDFTEYHNNNFQLKDYERAVSELNITFIFQKI